MNERAPVDARERWTHGDPYEQYVGRWSRLVAPAFLSWLRLPPGRRWVDVGCGTGALCDAICQHCSPSMVIGVEPSEGFLEAARTNLGPRADIRHGSATEMPLDDASADAVVSALSLNFVKDPPAALAEMARVTARGGTIGAYVWDYAGRMDLMRFFWDAAVELDPAAAQLDEGIRFPLCRPEPLQALFTASGLADVAVTPIDVPTRFADFEDYWQPFLGGQGPAPAYAMSLDQAARARLRERLRERTPFAADGSISLTARAWAVRGAMMRAR
jgi:SAM-dependent methyltransferase